MNVNEGLNDAAIPRELSGAYAWKGKGGAGATLPPPVFPPGGRRSKTRSRLDAGRTRGTAGRHSFMWPEASIWGRAGLDGALIFPDDPIPARTGALVAPQGTVEFQVAPEDRGGESEEVNADDVLVTGIGDDPHLSAADLLYAWDPDVAELVATVKKLAADLDRRGEAGLRTTPGMTHLERQLRDYCVGFLAGRRAAGNSR